MTTDELVSAMECKLSIDGPRIVRMNDGRVYVGDNFRFFPEPPKSLRKLQKKGCFYDFNIERIQFLGNYKAGNANRKIIEVKANEVKSIKKK